MASFLANLWESVFTPGPTPTLLIATNATFGLLQLLLFTLLIATYSIHFAILSILCGCLWWSINWFARELSAAQAKEAEAEKLRKRKRDPEWKRKGEVEDSAADDEGEDTEVEGDAAMRSSRTDDHDRVKEEIREAMGPESQSSGTGVTSGLDQAKPSAEMRQRETDDRSRSGEMSSTDSEWERVSQESDQ